VTITVASITGGALVSLMPDRGLTQGFPLLCLAPSVAAHLAAPVPNTGLAIVTALYMIFCCRMAGILNSGFWERIAEARLLARRTEELERSKEWMLISQSAAELETWDMDLASGAISGSPGYWKWHGFPPASQDSHRDQWLLSIHPEDRDAVREAMQSAVSRNHQWDSVYRVDTGAGARWLHNRACTQLDSSGRPVHLIGAVADITARREAEQKLEQYASDLSYMMQEQRENANMLGRVIGELEITKDRAEQATRAKSEFLASMSHEIRTPMYGLIGMVDLLSGTCLDAEQTDYIHALRISSSALLDIINDILDLSKMEAGHLVLEDAAFHLPELIEEAAELVAARAQSKGLSLRVQIDSDVPAWVQGDPVRLRQVILNLLGNSIKFTSSGGITVHAALTAHQADRCEVMVEVSDTGIGIPVDVQHRLFQPFSQADVSTTRKYGGTGLGLNISRRLIQMMRGDIGLRSEPGSGSTFWFTVALHVCADQRGEALRGLDFHGLTVAVIDPDPEESRLLASHLASLGATAVQAGSWDVMWKDPASTPPFAVFLTIDQDNGGIEMARQIHLRFPALPVIAVASFVNMLGHGELSQSGAVALLRKPFQRARVAACLRQIRDGGITNSRQTAGQPAPVRGRILVADDNAINQRVATAMLAKLGFAVTLAANGVEAIASFQQGSFDAILLDGFMPEMDGYTAAQRIREQEKAGLRRTPIIAVTASAMAGDRERCLAAGMDDYLAKPFLQSDLEKILRRWVRAAIVE
jgi:signal transduction histidine kinase/DNA-binding response OmpR family regulator